MDARKDLIIICALLLQGALCRSEVHGCHIICVWMKWTGAGVCDNGRCLCWYGWTGPNGVYIVGGELHNRIYADYCTVPCHYTRDFENPWCVYSGDTSGGRGAVDTTIAPSFLQNTKLLELKRKHTVDLKESKSKIDLLYTIPVAAIHQSIPSLSDASDVIILNTGHSSFKRNVEVIVRMSNVVATTNQLESGISLSIASSYVLPITFSCFSKQTTPIFTTNEDKMSTTGAKRPIQPVEYSDHSGYSPTGLLQSAYVMRRTLNTVPLPSDMKLTESSIVNCSSLPRNSSQPCSSLVNENLIIDWINDGIGAVRLIIHSDAIHIRSHEHTSLICARTHTDAHAHARTHTRARAHAHGHKHAHAHTRTRTRTQTRTQIRTVRLAATTYVCWCESIGWDAEKLAITHSPGGIGLPELVKCPCYFTGLLESCGSRFEQGDGYDNLIQLYNERVDRQ